MNKIRISITPRRDYNEKMEEQNLLRARREIAESDFYKSLCTEVKVEIEKCFYGSFSEQEFREKVKRTLNYYKKVGKC